jgi:uncharacterized protein (TIGR03083 family)
MGDDDRHEELERLVAGIDPYDLLDGETLRLDRHFEGLAPSDWEAPSRCAGWSVRDVLAHLAASEEYNAACLSGTVAGLLADWGARGATDLASANELGVRSFEGGTPGEILEVWRARSAQNRVGFRARDGGDVDSSIGPYPARWQAFHLAFEVATHAGDVFCPERPEEAAERLAWQVRFGCFVVCENRPGAHVEAGAGRTRIVGDGLDVELPDTDFVAAVAARLPRDHPLDPTARTYLSATP